MRQLDIPPPFSHFGALCAIDNVLVVPPSDADGPAALCGGIYAPEVAQRFPFIMQRRLTRAGWRSCERPYEDWSHKAHPSQQALAGRYLYLGPINAHFGHFLAECVHRAWGWSALQGQVDGAIVLPQHGNDASFRLWKDAFAHFGIPEEKLLFVRESVVCEQLVVPSQASTLGTADPHDSYIDFLSTLQGKYKAKADYPCNIYVSRAPYISIGGALGETFLEAVLKREGYFVFRPEEYSFAEQLSFYCNSKKTIFADGSAIHALEVLGRLDGQALMIVRGRSGDTLAKVGRKRYEIWDEDQSSQLLPGILPINRQLEENVNKAPSVYRLDRLLQKLTESGYVNSGYQPGFTEVAELCVALDLSRFLMHFPFANLARLTGGSQEKAARVFFTRVQELIHGLNKTKNKFLTKGSSGAESAVSIAERLLEIQDRSKPAQSGAKQALKARRADAAVLDMSVSEPGLRLTAETVRWLSRINGGKRYLEIGVAHRKAFLDLDLGNSAFKVGVDPGFQFDTSADAGTNMVLFHDTSDVFFSSVAHDLEGFDLIVLGGLYGFSQTFRDFCASMSVSHESTIWLIGNIGPKAISQAERQSDGAHKLGEMVGEGKGAWIGDAYKLVPTINDFFPQMSWAILPGGRQMVIWKQKRSFAPVGGGFDSISKLTHRDYLLLKESLYRQLSHQEIEELIRGAFGLREVKSNGSAENYS